MSVFQEQVQEQERALARVEKEKVALEQEVQRLSGLLNTANGEKTRLERRLEESGSENVALERRLVEAMAGQNKMAELVTAKEQADEGMTTLEVSLADATQVAAERAEQIDRLTDENSRLSQAKRDLEKEVKPMRALVDAWKDRLDADRRLAEEAAKLGD